MLFPPVFECRPWPGRFSFDLRWGYNRSSGRIGRRHRGRRRCLSRFQWGLNWRWFGCRRGGNRGGGLCRDRSGGRSRNLGSWGHGSFRFGLRCRSRRSRSRGDWRRWRYRCRGWRSGWRWGRWRRSHGGKGRFGLRGSLRPRRRGPCRLRPGCDPPISLQLLNCRKRQTDRGGLPCWVRDCPRHPIR